MHKEDNSRIPKGPYCRGYNGMTCPYWGLDKKRLHQLNGYCRLMEIGDWMEKSYSDLWDQCKCCGINEGWGDENNQS